MKKKIIFFAPNIEDGGIEKNIILLSDFFIKKNYVVEIIFSKISPKIRKKINHKVKLNKSNFNLNFFFKSRINNSINCFFYFLLKYKKTHNSIILSFQDHPFSIFTSIIKNIPCAIRIANHPIGSLKYFNNRINFFLKLFIKIIFYQFSDLIISNSKSSTNFFKRYTLNSKKCITIYNPLKLFKVSKNFKRNKNLLLAVGRLEKQKNFSCLIKAIKISKLKNPKLRLTIVGKGKEKKKLISLTNKLNLKKEIRFVGYKNPKKYYSTHGIMILSSFFEGLPNVLLESMSYKLPIVSSDCYSGPREILSNNKYGYLCRINDEYDLAKKILFVNNNYNSAIKKIKAGNKSLSNYDFKNQSIEYLKAVNSIFL